MLLQELYEESELTPHVSLEAMKRHMAELQAELSDTTDKEEKEVLQKQINDAATLIQQKKQQK
jgi:hypothetical protein